MIVLVSFCKSLKSIARRLKFLTSFIKFSSRLNNIPLPRFADTICKRFYFFECFTKIFVVKKIKQGFDQSGYSYQLLVSNSSSYLHVMVPLLYTPVYSRGRGLVLFSFLVCSLVIELREAKPTTTVLW